MTRCGRVVPKLLVGGRLMPSDDRIERMFGHLRINRAIATRYDRLANSFLGMVHLATARYWLQICPRRLKGPLQS
ncbi:transposase [Sphingobium indicum]|uniref:transposase n=1 Tax=Sphingobium indicum TaxID=332055 RepID=UPI00398B0933